MARTLTRPDRQNKLLLFGAIGLAVVAALLAFGSLRTLGGDGGGGATVGRVDVLVTTRAVAPGERVSEDMLAVSELPEDAIIENALTSQEGLVGLVVRYPLEKGEQVTGAKLGQREPGEDGTLADVVPEGKRAVTIEVTEQTVFGGLLVPGDHVDVMAVIEDFANPDALPRAVQLVQNAEVLAVADEPLQAVARLDKDGNPINSETADGELASPAEDSDAQPDASSVTLAVSPEDALIVALAQARWTISMALRGTNDNSLQDIRPRVLDFTE